MSSGCPIEPDLRLIARSWEALPPPIKAAILAMVNSAKGGE